MEKVTQYLESVPLAALIIAPIALLMLFAITPARHRVSVSVSVTTALLVLGQYVDLGAVKSAGRLGAPVMLCLVTLSAILDPSPKRTLHPGAWWYPASAIFGFLFIITVADFIFAFALRAQWLLLTVAAVTLARLAVDEAALRRILWAMTVGLCAVLFIPVLALMRDPGAAFRLGVGRFEPWGAASNQIGIYFGMTAPLALYFGFTSQRTVIRWMLFGCAMVALSMALLTASRSSLIVGVVGSVPVAMRLTRRPVLLATAAALFMVAASWFLAFMDTSKLDRLQSIETSRVQTAVEYVGVVAERPLLGMLQTSGASILSDESVGAHPHNAYLETLYLGGIVYAAPLFVLAAISLAGAWRIWRGRWSLPLDPLLTTQAAVLMVLVYAHGFVNGAIYYPTYAWAFLHVFLSVTVITYARDLRWLYANNSWMQTIDDEVHEAPGSFTHSVA